MDRRAALVLVVASGCGRVGFAEQSASDGADPPSAKFSRIAAHGDTTCAVYGGALYCWGKNSDSQLGDLGNVDDHSTPTAVPLPAGMIGDVAIGETHVCAIVDEALYCWGLMETTTAPAIAIAGRATHVSCGRTLICAIVDDAASCWGRNDVGQLGNMSEGAPDFTPQMVNLGARAVAIDAGQDHACALADGGAAWCWGHNDNGTLGNGSSADHSVVPVRVDAPIDNLPYIAGWHACAIVGGNVWCWGRGDMGELGDGLATDSAVPVQITSTGDATAIETGGGPDDFDATCAIRSGVASCWGSGLYGRLGTGDVDPATTPAVVIGLPPPVTHVAVGYGHSCAIAGDDDLYCWGHNESGQLGRGTRTLDERVPGLVLEP